MNYKFNVKFKINANYKVRTGRPEYPTVGKSNLLDFFSNIFTSPLMSHNFPHSEKVIALSEDSLH